MNILIIGKFYTEGFALHIAETLATMGHTVKRFDPGFKSGRIGRFLGHDVDKAFELIYSATDSLSVIRASRMKALWQVVEQGSLDVVIVGHDFLWPLEVDQLKRLTRAPVAMWLPDSIANFGRSLFMNAAYDGLFFKDPYIIHAMGDVLKSPVYFLPECFNPDRHYLPEKELDNLADYQCEITTAGNQHSWRLAFYKHLASYNVNLWGSPSSQWAATGAVSEMYKGRPVYNHEKVRAFRGAKIVVNNLFYGEIWGVNARCFEAAGAGAFQMVDWRPGLNELFADGTELITFRSMFDLKQKIDYWLPREAERGAIAKAGMLRAHADHTYKHRLELLLATLSGSAHGYSKPNLHNGEFNSQVQQLLR